MTEYASTDDLEDFGLPGDWITAVPEEAQLRAIARASALADGYLSARYTLPLTSWGEDLRGAVVDIATYYLCTSNVGYNPAQSSTDQSIAERYSAATMWLRDVGSGKANPSGVVDSTAVTDPATSDVLTVASDAPRGWWP